MHNILQTTIALLLCCLTTVGTANAVTFDNQTRYSQLVINARLNDYYSNTSHVGFAVFDSNGTMTAAQPKQQTTLDYVTGLVAKAVLEAVDYYKDSPTIDARPWWYAVQDYALNCDISSNGKNGKSFDDLNAVKVYSLLSQLAASGTFPDGAAHTNAATITTAATRFHDALQGISKANSTYAIKASVNAKAAGGWWHKSQYDNQMWCDGQYMGPALLAQIINDYADYTPITTSNSNSSNANGNSGTGDWDLITRQFDISWNYLWNTTDRLLYHAFSATPTASTSLCWASLPCSYDNTCSTNTAYWGRADAWYLLALVDVLQQMDCAGLTSADANYQSIQEKLQLLAEGIAARQDATTGCWYQLLDEDASFSSNGTQNYLESSASAIFCAAFFKAMRLGYLPKKYLNNAFNAYRGIVTQFMVDDGNGGVHLISSCRSAGLGGSSNRQGDKNYYLNGSDVTRTTAQMKQTEGKVLGAFILAATEYERTVIDGGTGIESPLNKEAVPSTPGRTYNVSGQQVESTARGLLLKQGKVVISK